MVEFCNNKEYQEMPFRSSVLPLWMLVFALLNASVLSFDVIMIKNELWLLIFYHCFRRLGKPLFPFLDHQGRCRIYINSSTWHHIFIILATILDHNKCCRNDLEAGIKWTKCPKLSNRAKNGCIWENNISTVTRLLTLRFGWQMSTGVIYRPVKDFSTLSILDKLLLAKKHLKLCLLYGWKFQQPLCIII